MAPELNPYSEYRSSGLQWLGPIPTHWQVMRTKFLFREIDQRSKTGRETHLSMSQVHGLIDSNKIDQRRLQSESYVGGKLCRAGDLVLNRLKAHLGVFAHASQPGVVSPDYTVFRLARSGDVRFFELLFKTPEFIAELRRSTKGIVEGFWRLYTDDFYNIRAIVPPDAEQAAIVAFIGWLDREVRRFVRNNRRLIDLLDEQKRASIHRAITKGIDSNVPAKTSCVHWIGDVPSHWGIWQIGHLARIGNGSTPARGNAAYWVGGQYPWLNSSSVNHAAIRGADQFVTDAALRECHLPRVQPGSVLVGITGQGKTRGKAALLEMEATINQHIAYITPESKLISEQFLQICLTAAYSELRAISEDAGSTKGALTCEDLRHFRIAVPPRCEQASIVAMVRDECRDLELAAGVIERKISLVREYRSRLIADLVTGRLDVSHLPEVMEPKFTGMDALDEQADVADEEPAETDELEAAEEVAIGDD